ncbi:hypothetical protein ES703_84696 [subsurface metagenome]
MDSFSEAYQIQIQCVWSDVFQFNEFRIWIVVWVARVFRMVHHLCDAQVIGDGADGKSRFVKRAPGAAVQYPCLDVGAFVQCNLSGISRSDMVSGQRFAGIRAIERVINGAGWGTYCQVEPAGNRPAVLVERRRGHVWIKVCTFEPVEDGRRATGKEAAQLVNLSVQPILTGV